MLDNVLNKTFFHNSVLDYIVFLAMIVLGVLLIKVLAFIISKSIRRWVEKTKTGFDEFLLENIQKNLMPLLYYGVF